jgi:hypothetical protein
MLILRAATLQQSCTFAFKYGVSGILCRLMSFLCANLVGGFWYGFAVIIVMSIFSLCGVELRRKAPHFKTYLEVCDKVEELSFFRSVVFF